MHTSHDTCTHTFMHTCTTHTHTTHIHNTQVSGINLTFPPKKLFGANDRQFLIERQQGLQEFLNAVLTQPLFSSALEVKRFLDPQNYSDNFYGKACALARHRAS